MADIEAQSHAPRRNATRLPSGAPRVLAGAKADVPVRLHDGRLMAIECKVSSSAVNRMKRLLRETGGKARLWHKAYGQQVIAAAVLSGVLKLNNLLAAQESHRIALFGRLTRRPCETSSSASDRNPGPQTASIRPGARPGLTIRAHVPERRLNDIDMPSLENHAERPPRLVIRNYGAKNVDNAARLFADDSRVFTLQGYVPVAQAWAPGQWEGGQYAVGCLLSIVGIGLVLLLYMLIVKPGGVLTVTYEMRHPEQWDGTVIAPASKVSEGKPLQSFVPRRTIWDRIPRRALIAVAVVAAIVYLAAIVFVSFQAIPPSLPDEPGGVTAFLGGST